MRSVGDDAELSARVKITNRDPKPPVAPPAPSAKKPMPPLYGATDPSDSALTKAKISLFAGVALLFLRFIAP